MRIRQVSFMAILTVLLAAFLTGVLLYDNRLPRPDQFVLRSENHDDLFGVIRKVDQQFLESWEVRGLEPSGVASDLTIVRRMSLALTGTIPSLQEIRFLEQQVEGDPVQWWLSRLFEDRRYADYVAERLARGFVGIEQGPFIKYRRRLFLTWLSDQLIGNVPYDELAQQLISAQGNWMDNPAVNFCTVTIAENDDQEGPDEKRLAARVSRSFLGLRIDCVQCHDDFMGGHWKQQDFHQLASFFSGTELSLSGLQDREHVYEFQYHGAEAARVVPSGVPFQQALLPDEGTPRFRLARWVTHPENRAFSRAVVNKVWALLLGRPLVDPVDEIPLEGPYPPALELLASDLVEHDYNLQRLIRVIAASRVFRMDSQGRVDQPIPSEQHEKHWAVFPVIRLRPEQVAGSLIQASSLKTINAQSHVVMRIMKFFVQNEFLKRYGDKGEEEFNLENGTVPQRLLMMNGELVRNKTSDNLIFNASSRIALLASDNEKAVEAVYLSILTRRPIPDEHRYFVSLLSESPEKREEIIQDLCWVLFNTTEFSWNH